MREAKIREQQRASMVWKKTAAEILEKAILAFCTVWKIISGY